MKATNSRPNTKVMLSWLLEVRGTGRSPLATRSCACRSKTADLKASMRISPPASGYPVSSAQKCGDALPRLQSPRMARCWSLMTRAARSGVLPIPARVTVPLHIRIGRNRNGKKRLWAAFFVVHVRFWHKADISGSKLLLCNVTDWRIVVSRATVLNYTGDAIGSICDRWCGCGPRPARFAGIGGAFDHPHHNQNNFRGGPS